MAWLVKKSQQNKSDDEVEVVDDINPTSPSPEVIIDDDESEANENEVSK